MLQGSHLQLLHKKIMKTGKEKEQNKMDYMLN